MKMPPRSLAVLFLGLLLLPAQASLPGGPEPKAADLERYQGLIRNSPFALATAPVAAPTPVVEAPSFARDYYVVGLAQLGEKPFVTISSRDRQQQFSLLVGETSSGGITLASVEWLPEVGKSRVTIQRGTEFGVVSFDEAAMRLAPPPVVANKPPTQGGAAPQPGYLPQPPPQGGERRGRGMWGNRRGGGGGGGARGGDDAAHAERMRVWRERQRSIGNGQQR